MTTRKLIVPTIAVAILAVGLVGWKSITQAATTNKSQTLVQKLADKFNVSKDEVQKVFDAYHQERQKDFDSKANSRLDQAVKDGVITEDQKQKLIVKRSEIISERKKDNQDLKQWMTDNGIDMSKLRGYGFGMGGFGFGHHHHDRGHRGWKK